MNSSWTFFKQWMKILRTNNNKIVREISSLSLDKLVKISEFKNKGKLLQNFNDFFIINNIFIFCILYMIKKMNLKLANTFNF